MCKRTVILGFSGIGLVLLAADQPAQPVRFQSHDIGVKVIILGALGLPVGEEMVIHGKTVFAGKGSNGFHVDQVNGKRLQPGRSISVDGIEDWPLGTEAEIRGYEKGSLEFTDIRKTGFAHNDPRFVLRQDLLLWFHVVDVLKPRDLKIEPVNR